MSVQGKIRQIITLLASEYGKPVFQPDHDPLSTLVKTILSQNTSDVNSHRAFASLQHRFTTWEDVAEADVHKIVSAIRVGGLAEIKANRIKQVLSQIKEKRGKLELDFLPDLPLVEAKEWLRQLPGVGTKTACCVLLFSFGLPALPVDTHILRVSKRLGLVGTKASAEEAHQVLEGLVPADSVYRFHVLMIEHGRRTCKAQRPQCLRCVLGGLCPSYEVFTGRKKETITY
ncbi:MAG: endonuclease III [Chloroflexi bacterium]|nr:endonuclease III [Chloroflexota bacterium]